MSKPWQFQLLWIAWATLLAGGPSASVALAQCSRGGGGFNPRISQGLISQRLLQQQQSLQQQQLLLIQQQQLQTAKLEKQMRDLAKEGPDALKTSLKDANPEMRLIAVLTVGEYGPALRDDLIERLTDDNTEVRQAARRALVSLSTSRDGKRTMGRSVDFGPAVNANRKAQDAAARKWRDWFERQRKSKDESKDVAAKSAG